MTDLSTILVDGQNIDMAAFRAWLTGLDDRITNGIDAAALAAALTVVYETRAELDADLAHDAGTVGLVWGDPTDANNDLYVKTGASGAGAWTLTTFLHDTIDALSAPARLRAQNSVPFPTWTELTTATGMIDGDRATVLVEDDGTHVDPVTAATVANAGLYQYDAGTPGWERIADLDGQTAAAAAATVSSLVRNANFAGSLMFPDENGEARDHLETGQLYIAGTNTAGGANPITSGGDALWAGDSAVLLFFDIPVETYRGLNRNPCLIGTASNTANRAFKLVYFPTGHNSNPATHYFQFSINGNSTASAAWTCNTNALPIGVKRGAIRVVRSGDNMQIDVFDAETRTWTNGVPVAKPAGFIGATLLSNDTAIGTYGQLTGAGFPFDWDSGGGSVPQAIPNLRGSLKDVTITDVAVTQADVEAIFDGTAVLDRIAPADVRLYCPLVNAQGEIDLSVFSNIPAIDGLSLTQQGTVLPGPTITRQTAAKYFVLEQIDAPGIVAFERTAKSQRFSLAGKMAGLSGFVQYSIADRAGNRLLPWRRARHTVAGTDVTVHFELPASIEQQFQLLARFTSDPSLIAATHCNMQGALQVLLWSQSEGVISTIGGVNNTGQNTVLNVRPEAGSRTVTWVATNGVVRFTGIRPGLMGDPAVNIANYLRRRTSRPIVIGCHTISGTGLRDLMDDAQGGRQWADEVRAHSFPINVGPSGEFVVAGHVKIGWEASDNVLAYSEGVNVPWYQGRGWNGAAVGFNVNHWLYDGTFSDDALSVELPCNRATASNAAASATTDGSNEDDQRSSQRNWGHLLGYMVGPPQCTHKMEGENAAGGLLVAATHPERNDWEGALEMSFANAEAIAMIVGVGTYPGPVFFEEIRAGSAADKVIVRLGNPRPFPGEGSATPNVGFSTSYARARTPLARRLRTKKAGGNAKWGFEAKINNAGAWSIANVTAATILNPLEVELTLSANYVPGETQIRYQPGTPGSYKDTTVTQENWRSGQLFFTGQAFVAGQEPGFAVTGNNQALVLAP